MSFCYVLNCKSQKRRHKDLSFYSIPGIITNQSLHTRELSLKRRNAWIKALKQEKIYKPLKWHRVCSRHFITGKPSFLEDEAHPDWVPTLNLGYDTLSSIKCPKSKLESHNRYLERAKKKIIRVKEASTSFTDESCHFTDDSSYLEDENTSSSFEAEITEQDGEMITAGENTEKSQEVISEDFNMIGNADQPFSIDVGSQCTPDVSDFCMQTAEILQTSWSSSSTQTDLSMANISELELIANRKCFDKSYIESNEPRAVYYTGLPNLTIIIATFNLLAIHVQPSLTAKLSLFQEYLVTLLRLRLDLDIQDLAFRFDVSISTISRVTDKWLDIISVRLDKLIKWPSRDELRLTMPNSFSCAFGKRVAVIIDCFEIFIERPSSLDARAETWSNYKHHNTMKFLIGITPQGSVSFISEAWGGRTSDKHITEECKILDNLLPGDLILADRGFNITEAVGFFCAEVAIPAFTRGKKQLSAKEIGETRKIANVRIHVERVIGHTRNKFRILQSTIPIDYLINASGCKQTKLDKIVKACCALINICDSVVRFD